MPGSMGVWRVLWNSLYVWTNKNASAKTWWYFISRDIPKNCSFGCYSPDFPAFFKPVIDEGIVYYYICTAITYNDIWLAKNRCVYQESNSQCVGAFLNLCSHITFGEYFNGSDLPISIRGSFRGASIRSKRSTPTCGRSLIYGAGFPCILIQARPAVC